MKFAGQQFLNLCYVIWCLENVLYVNAYLLCISKLLNIASMIISKPQNSEGNDEPLNIWYIGYEEGVKPGLNKPDFSLNVQIKILKV